MTVATFFITGTFKFKLHIHLANSFRSSYMCEMPEMFNVNISKIELQKKLFFFKKSFFTRSNPTQHIQSVNILTPAATVAEIIHFFREQNNFKIIIGNIYVRTNYSYKTVQEKYLFQNHYFSFLITIDRTGTKTYRLMMVTTRRVHQLNQRQARSKASVRGRNKKKKLGFNLQP